MSTTSVTIQGSSAASQTSFAEFAGIAAAEPDTIAERTMAAPEADAAMREKIRMERTLLVILAAPQGRHETIAPIRLRKGGARIARSLLCQHPEWPCEQDYSAG
jgi:hypothetical protein